MLKALGWNLSDPSVVLVEDSQTNNQRPDYQLLGASAESPMVVIEAKRIVHGDIEYIYGPQDPEEDPTEDWIEWGEDDVWQLRRYVEAINSGYGVLTDGNAWAIWDLSKGKPGDLKPEPYVWTLCEDPAYASSALKVLHRRNVH